MLKIDWRNCVTRALSEDVYDCEIEGRPPTSKTGVAKIHICEDTSYVFFRAVILTHCPTGEVHFEEDVKQAKELAKGAKDGKWKISIGGREVEVWAKGASRWFPYVVEINGTRLLWSGKTDVEQGKWNFEVQFGSALLWRLGGLEHAWRELGVLCSEFGLLMQENLISKNDIAHDFIGIDVEQFAARVFSRRCVRRARNLKPVFKSSAVVVPTPSEDGEISGETVVPVLSGLRLETLDVGSDSGLKVTIYDKVAELKKNKTKQALFTAIWGGDQQIVTRVEFKLNRSFFGECGVRTVEDYLAHRRNIASYLVRHWFRLTEEPVQKNHTLRAVTWSVWKDLTSAVEQRYGKPQEQVVRVHSLSIDNDQMDRQILGCLASVVAWKAGRDLTEAEAMETLTGEMIRLVSRVHWPEFVERAGKAIAKARKVLGT